MIDALSKLSTHINKKEHRLAHQCVLQLLRTHAENLHLLSLEYQRQLLELMMSPYCKPRTSLSIEQLPNADEVKSALLDMIERMRDPVIRQNALLQSLCKGTALGQIFHLQRHHFLFFSHPPSVLSGRLKIIAAKVSRLDITQASPVTKVALRDESHRRFIFLEQLSRYFPSLHRKIVALDMEIVIGPKLSKTMIF